MSTKHEMRELVDLRGRGLERGPLWKLMEADEKKVSLVDLVRIQRLLTPILAELKTYETTYAKLMQKYGTPDPKDPARVLLPLATNPEQAKLRQEFDAELEALEGLPVEVRANPLPQSAWQPLGLTARDLHLLQKFVVLPDPEEIPPA